MEDVPKKIKGQSQESQQNDGEGASIDDPSDQEDNASISVTKNCGDPTEVVQISDSIFLFQNKKLSQHGNVFKGEIRSGVYDVRVCAIKFARRSEENFKEAEILTNLASHTHIVSIIQSGTYRGVFEEHVYIALEKCHEHNLGQHFMSQKEAGLEFNLNEALEYSKQIIAGVTYVHEKLIVHKDLKPSNILLTPDKSTIKLADFGLSQEIKSTSSKVFCKHQFGTIGYRPLESFGNSWMSLKSDTFSLGTVLYFVLSNGESPFGDDIHLWIYNTKHGVKDFSKLLVPNKKAFQHLIKLMLCEERCRRPSIWEVSTHPCWTAGNKVDCDFDYGCVEEIDDSDVQIPDPQREYSSDSETERENFRAFVIAMENDFVIDRSTSMQKSIAIFDGRSNHLQLFKTNSGTVTKFRKYQDQMMEGVFSAIVLGDYVYVFRIHSAHRLKHNSPTALWERIEDLIQDHGLRPPVVATADVIYFAASAAAPANKSLSKYDPLLIRWSKQSDKRLATHSSALVASQDYVYCIGGFAAGIGETDRVERFNIHSETWEEVAAMPGVRYHAAAVDYYGKIFVAGGRDRNHRSTKLVQQYDPLVNAWTTMKPMPRIRWGPWFRCHVVEGKIYAVAGGGENQTIDKYDVEKDEWEGIEIPGDEIWVRASVVLRLMK